MARAGKGRFVALLRGINVGGRHVLPMAELRELFGEAGGVDVRTYVQSGNVAFGASARVARRVPALVESAVRERFGFEVPVVLRSAEEIEAVVAGNPFLDSAPDERALHVGFLVDAPEPDRVAALDPERSPGDSFVVSGREVYFLCPNGLARTKLTSAYFDTRLDTVMTVRNWRTTRKLLEMVRA